MASVYFGSDFHLDHKNIGKFRTEFSGPEENEEFIFKDWGKKVTKRDLVILTGDIAFSYEALRRLGELPGRKILCRGNHDNYVTTEQLLEVFESVEGLYRRKNLWLSHAPIHPSELRGKKSVHGHCHYFNMKEGQYTASHREDYNHSLPDDKRYLNICVENVMRMNGGALIHLDEIRKYFGES